MSTSTVVCGPFRAPGPAPTRRPWLAAALAPLVAGGPWLLACHLAGAAPTAGSLSAVVLVLLLGVATITDLLWRRIFNWSTYTAAAWAVALAALAPTPALPAQDAILGLLVGFAITFLAYLLFQGGAGDVKLVAALGALLGPGLIVSVVFHGYLLAATFALAYLAWKAGTGTGARGWLQQRLPMAPFIAAGVIAAVALA